jgi:hypothetical protein
MTSTKADGELRFHCIRNRWGQAPDQRIRHAASDEFSGHVVDEASNLHGSTGLTRKPRSAQSISRWRRLAILARWRLRADEGLMGKAASIAMTRIAVMRIHRPGNSGEAGRNRIVLAFANSGSSTGDPDSRLAPGESAGLRMLVLAKRPHRDSAFGGGGDLGLELFR